MLACISGCRGVIGFKVGTWPCPVREKVRPAWPDGGRECEKVRPASSKRPKNTVFRRVGRTFSRKCRWRGRAGQVFSRKCRWMGHAGRTFSRLLWQRSSFWRIFVEKSRFLSRNDDICNAGRSRAPRPGPGEPRLQSPNEAPAHASCGGGRQHSECSEGKQCKRH